MQTRLELVNELFDCKTTKLIFLLLKNFKLDSK